MHKYIIIILALIGWIGVVQLLSISTGYGQLNSIRGNQMIKDKKCRECGIIKPLDSFHRDRRLKDGHRSICTQCSNNTLSRHTKNKYIHLDNGITKIIITSYKYGIKECLIDTIKYEIVSKHWWIIIKKKNRERFYAQTNLANTTIQMHRLIMDFPKRMQIDHKNNNGLDNRCMNLRKATQSQNSYNQFSRGGTSNFKGVKWNKRGKVWESSIGAYSKNIYLGRFEKEIDAAKAYNCAARILHGEFYCGNKINICK